MILVDTGAWYAAACPRDANHAAAKAWLAQNRQPLMTTDYICDETVTLLRARGERTRAVQLARELFAGELAVVHFLTMEQIGKAADVFRAFDDKDWSFTDCTSKVAMADLGIQVAFSFDTHFRQFGHVTVVP